MAQFDSIRSAAGARSAEIDAGLRAHMNKVYGTMSVGTLITFLAAWAIAGLSVTSDPANAVAQLSSDSYLTNFGYAIYASPLKWVIMFAPLAFVFFGFGAAVNRLSAAGVQVVFYAFAALMGLSISSIFVTFTGESIAQVFLVTSIAFAGLSLVGYTTKKRPLWHGFVPDHGSDRPDRGVGCEHLPRVFRDGVCNLRDRCSDLCGPHRL